MHKQLRAPPFLLLLALPLLLMIRANSSTAQLAVNALHLSGRGFAFGVCLARESTRGAGLVHNLLEITWVMQNG